MTFWVLPLFDFMPGWRNASAEPRSRASRIVRLAEVPAGLASANGWPPRASTDWAHFIPFRLDGRPAAIEPLPDYEESRRLLREGGERRLITAVAMGEVGDRDARSEALWEWFPIDIFEALGFASGIKNAPEPALNGEACSPLARLMAESHCLMNSPSVSKDRQSLSARHIAVAPLAGKSGGRACPESIPTRFHAFHRPDFPPR